MTQTARKRAVPRVSTDATAEVFHVAFRALPEATRDRLIELLLTDEDFRDHIEGALLWEQRRNEPRISADALAAKVGKRAR